MTILLLGEHDNSQLSEQTGKALSACMDIGGDIHILIAGHECSAVADEASQLNGVSKVLLAQGSHLEHMLAESMSDLLMSLSEGYDTFVAPATSNGKNVMPRLAALLDVMQISDIITVKAPDTFERPIYAGNAIETVKTSDAKKVITIRTAGFAPAPSGGAASVENVDAGQDAGLTTYRSSDLSGSDRPELTSAKIVISGGRALGSSEKFQEVILPVADKLGAAVGASRAAVDAGYAPNDWQVGQTGKVVAPDLYIACGISGAIQHLAGMKDSKVIVAINKDEEAPIFQIADYGLVADLFEALPQLQEAL